MEGSFIHSSPNRTIMWGGNPLSSEDTNIRATDTASDMTGAIRSPDPQDGDMATLIGVVSEPADLERFSDDQLMVALAGGDCAALEKLYDRHVRRCFGLALTLVQEPSLAEDIVQEVFVKLWSRPEMFSPERGIFHKWLLSVVHNRALDKLRQAKSRSAIHVLPLHPESARSDALVDLLPDSAPTPHDEACTKETAGVVRHALRQLPAPEYQIIVLAYFGGLTQREIADKLNQPLGTVKTRTRSALRRLHHLLLAQGALSD